MSDMKNFDSFFKQSFSQYTPEVPLYIWDNIAAKKEDKKMAPFWWNTRTMLLIGILITAATGAIVLLLPGSPHPVLESYAVPETTKTVSPKMLLSAKENTAASGADNIARQPRPVTISNNLVKSGAGATVPTGNNLAVATSSAADTYIPVTGSSTGGVKPGILGKKGRNNSGRKTTTARLKDSGIDAATEDNNINGEGSPLSPTAETQEPPFSRFTRMQLDAAQHLSLTQLQRTAITMYKRNLPVTIPDCPKAERDAAGNKSYLEVYLAPDLVTKKYSDTGNSMLVQNRKGSLRIENAYSAGLRYTRVFNNGISVRAGVNYSRIVEKFTYKKDDVVQITYVLDPGGNVTDSFYVRGTRYKNSYNYYNSFDIPVTMGYEMGNSKFHANINAGIVINIYSWQQGETLDNNNLPVSITTGKEENPYQYKTNAGLGFTGAVSLYYKLNDKLHIMAEPYIRYNFSPLNRDAITLQEKFTTMGVRLGLRVDF